MTDVAKEPFASWAIVELMGHRQRAGFVTEAEIAGGKLLRVDIPAALRSDEPDVTVTEFYGISSIYALRPCTEEVARDFCGRYIDDVRPVRPVEYRESERIKLPPSPSFDETPF